MRLAKIALCAAASAAVLGWGADNARAQGAWEGFYGGLHGGYAWSDLRTKDVDGFVAGAPAGTVTKQGLDGAVLGAQLGYNWQRGAFVFGAEVDLGWMGQGGDRLLTGTVANTRAGLDSGMYGDITGRLGFTTGPTLFYVKGGWAFYDGSSRFSSTVPIVTATQGGTLRGYTLGAGIEQKLSYNTSLKLEYQRFEFGTSEFSINGFRFRQDLDTDVVKIGLNFRLGEERPPAYVPMK